MIPQIYDSSVSRKPPVFETRRIQNNGNSLIVSLPLRVAQEVGIRAQDIVRIYIPRSNKRQIVMEKIIFEDLNEMAVPLSSTTATTE
jgi:antitoxin component of MazEF toxin-antitoxin module